MEYKIKVWWDRLSDKEREILITALYEQDLAEIGIYQDKKGEYKR